MAQFIFGLSVRFVTSRARAVSRPAPPRSRLSAYFRDSSCCSDLIGVTAPYKMCSTVAGIKKTLVMSKTRRNVIDLASLLASRMGGLLVSLIFLPIYVRLLGLEIFGAITTILALQTLALFLDLGSATFVGREVAVVTGRNVDNRGDLRKLFWECQLIIVLAYGLLLIIALGTSLLIQSNIPTFIIGSTVILCWLLVVQNIAYSCLINGGFIRSASLLQPVALLTRSLITALALFYIGPNLIVFLSAQILVALISTIATIYFLKGVLGPLNARKTVKPKQMFFLLSQLTPLALAGLAAAFAGQVDKLLISAMRSPEAVGPYFLAFTFAAVPIAILSGPIAQFFQPRLIGSIAAREHNRSIAVSKNLARAISYATIPISISLSIFTLEWCEMWIRDVAVAERVSHYASILLLGSIIGSFGYPPNIMLLSKGVYSFLSRLQGVSSVFYMSCSFIGLLSGLDIDSVAWSYVGYNMITTFAQWRRCMITEPERHHATAMLWRMASDFIKIGLGFSPILVFVLFNSDRLASMAILTLFASIVAVIGVISAMRSGKN